MKTLALLSGVALAALAMPACGGDGDGVTPAKITLTSKRAPKRADGYWALKNVGSGGTVIGTQHLCVGRDSEERGSIFDQIALNVNCSTYDFKRTDAGWNFETVCGRAPMVSDTKGTISGDFAKAYKIEMTAKEGDFTQSRTIKASNEGACPAGVIPGDLMDENGKKVTNILN